MKLQKYETSLNFMLYFEMQINNLLQLVETKLYQNTIKQEFRDHPMCYSQCTPTTLLKLQTFQLQ